MTESWKKKIDARIAEEERMRLLKIKLDEIARKAQEQEKNQRQIRELGNKFQCCVCGKRAVKPLAIYNETRECVGMREFSHFVWTTPGDLCICKICKQWACSDHIYQEICQNCAEKL